GRVHLGPGTLYGAIKRMLQAGLMQESDQRPDPEMDDQRRRYYRLTALGRRTTEAEAARLAELLRTAVQKRLLKRSSLLDLARGRNDGAFAVAGPLVGPPLSLLARSLSVGISARIRRSHEPVVCRSGSRRVWGAGMDWPGKPLANQWEGFADLGHRGTYL